MKPDFLFKTFFMLACVFVISNEMYAKSISLNFTHPNSSYTEKNERVTQLKISGVINKNTISTILSLYPNVEEINMLNAKIEAFTDENQVLFPENMISPGAFSNKIKLKTIILPRGVTVIGKGAFWKCTSLQNVILPDSIQVIEQFAFQLCGSLKKINLPKSLHALGGSSFDSCKSLVIINFMSKTPPVMPDWNPFTEINSNTCVVYVPKDSMANYKNCYFLNAFQIKSINI